jgi:hypothetical protein
MGLSRQNYPAGYPEIFARPTPGRRLGLARRPIFPWRATAIEAPPQGG